MAFVGEPVIYIDVDPKVGDNKYRINLIPKVKIYIYY